MKCPRPVPLDELRVSGQMQASLGRYNADVLAAPVIQALADLSVDTNQKVFSRFPDINQMYIKQFLG